MPDARTTRVVTEVAVSGDPQVRVTRSGLEVFVSGTAEARVSRVAAEYLVVIPPPVFPTAGAGWGFIPISPV